MAIDLDRIQSFTDEDVLKILRKSLVDSAIAQSYSIGGRNLSRHGIEGIQRLIEVYEGRIARKKRRRGFRTLLARFGEPR